MGSWGPGFALLKNPDSTRPHDDSGTSLRSRISLEIHTPLVSDNLRVLEAKEWQILNSGTGGKQGTQVTHKPHPDLAGRFHVGLVHSLCGCYLEHLRSPLMDGPVEGSPVSRPPAGMAGGGERNKWTPA
ncbi:hypothetical protein NDU88_001958 [Pleurodeles waltl]|uniref:Uncharacterized protein n=1 Tax=Pleurodeles waltl TaxID=8319 RepID=A0AAV7SE52_PLEWA|nr:hypothetical protein NDU88_001958 [Pleurodeles waltl]